MTTREYPYTVDECPHPSTQLEGVFVDEDCGAVASARCEGCGRIFVGIDPAPPKATSA